LFDSTDLNILEPRETSSTHFHLPPMTTSTPVSLNDARLECSKNISSKWSILGGVIGIPLGIYLSTGLFFS
jgi:hypothetical protein